MSDARTDVVIVGAGLAGLACALRLNEAGAGVRVLEASDDLRDDRPRAVGAPGYAAYQDEHTRLTTLVVGPLMLLEAATALWLV